MVKCIYCKNDIPPGANGCPYCLDVPIKLKLKNSKSKTVELIAGILGGTLSLLMGVFLLILFPAFQILGSSFISILQTFIILGGVITIFATISFYRAEGYQAAKIARITVLFSSLLAGGNWISIYAAWRMKKNMPVKEEKISVIRSPRYGTTDVP